MIIVGDNLKELIGQHGMVEPNSNSYDVNSIALSLDKKIIHIIPDLTENPIVTYGSAIPTKWIKEVDINNHDGIIIEPKSCILACSYEKITIPMGYFGLLQTKGSLARLFVSLHCSDGQIEAGFNGKITFEICNLSNFKVRLRPGDKVGSLFIMKASTRDTKPYKGRYNSADRPTIQTPQQ